MATRKVVNLHMQNGRMERPAEVMNLIRLAMYGKPVPEMAQNINRSSSCLYSIRRGKTKWPRGETLFGVLTELGYEVRVTKK